MAGGRKSTGPGRKACEYPAHIIVLQSNFGVVITSSSTLSRKQTKSTSSNGRPTRSQRKSVGGDRDMDVDNSSDEEIRPTIKSAGSSPGSKLLKAVAIPLTSTASPAPRGGRKISNSVSSESSVLSDHSELSDDYETPGTSAVVTPAEFGNGGRKKGLQISNGKYKNMLSKITTAEAITPSASSAKGKRKRVLEDSEDEKTVLDAQIAEDVRLAEALQHEEYHVISSDSDKPVKQRGRGKKVLDSEDDMDSLMERSSDRNMLQSSRASSAHANHQGVKKRKILGRPAIPTRTVRPTAIAARKSIAEKLPIVANTDDEDESELSDYLSESNSGLDYSDDSLDEGDFDTSAPIADTSAVSRPTHVVDRSARSQAVRRNLAWRRQHRGLTRVKDPKSFFKI
jgi:hypothetical protein